MAMVVGLILVPLGQHFTKAPDKQMVNDIFFASC